MTHGRPPGDALATRAVAGLLAVAVAAVVVSPQLRFAGEHGWDGVVFFGAKDAEFYAAQVRHAADGTYGHANDLLAEYSGGDTKSAPWTYGLLAAGWRACRAVCGADLHVFLTWSLGVFAAVQFLLFAAIGRAVGLRRVVALATATACCLAPFLWSYVGGAMWLGHPDRVSTGFLPLARPVNPSLSSVIVWGAVLALLRWARRPGLGAWCLLTAIVAAAWSAYPAAFLFSGAFLAAGVIVEAAGRRWRRSAALAATGALAVALNLPSILASAAPPTGDAADVAASNLLGLATRAPILSANTATAIAVAIVWGALRAGRRSRPRRALLVAGAPLALLLVFNLQVITGRLDQPFHYDWFYAVPLVWLGGAVVATELWSRARPAATRFRVPAAGRAVVVIAGAVVVLSVAAAFGGETVAGWLRALRVIRGEQVARPGVFLLCGLAVAASLVVGRALVVAHRWRLVRALAVGAVAACAFVEGWRLQDFEYVRRRAGCVEMQPLRAALRHIESLGSTDDAVAASDDGIARLVPSYTGRNVLISAEVQFAFAPSDEEFRRRRMVNLAIFGLPPDRFAAGLGDSGKWHADVFKWRTFGAPPPGVAALSHGAHLARLHPDDADRIAAAYREISARPRAALLREFRVDWVLWRAASAASGLSDPGPGDGLVLALEGPGFRLYRVAR